MKLKQCILFFLFMFFANNALARENVKSPPEGWTLGLGAAYSTSPYRGVDSESMPFPMVSYQGKRIFLRGPQLGYGLVKQNGLNLAVLSSYRFQGYDSDDSPFLQGMADRNGTLEAGLLASLTTTYGQIRLSLLSDILDEHNGHEAKLTLSKRFRFKRLLINPSVSTIWQSGQLANYYYGVTQAEAAIGRPVYEVEATLTLQAGLMANYMLSKHWSITGRMDVKRLSEEISDSPIVSDGLVTKGFLGVGYRF